MADTASNYIDLFEVDKDGNFMKGSLLNKTVIEYEPQLGTIFQISTTREELEDMAQRAELRDVGPDAEKRIFGPTDSFREKSFYKVVGIYHMLSAVPHINMAPISRALEEIAGVDLSANDKLDEETRRKMNFERESKKQIVEPMFVRVYAQKLSDEELPVYLRHR